jgi:hypothetical protein
MGVSIGSLMAFTGWRPTARLDCSRTTPMSTMARGAMRRCPLPNAEHGLRRTGEDKKRAVLVILRDP